MDSNERKIRDRAILFGHMNGDSTQVLAERHNLDVTTINGILRSQGTYKQRETTQRNGRIMDLFQQGLSRQEVAERVGVPVHIVDKTRRRNGYRWSGAEIECGICGEGFLQQAHNARYCSEACSAEATRRRDLEWDKNSPGVWKTCEFCKKPYKGYGRRGRYLQRFCSYSCSNSYNTGSHKKQYRDELIVEYREVDGLTFKRIGEIFNISKTRVHQVYYRQVKARAMRRAELAG